MRCCAVLTQLHPQIGYTLPWIIMLSQLAYYSKVYGPQVCAGMAGMRLGSIVYGPQLREQ